MTRTARAAVFVAPNRPFEQMEYPLREPRCGEALVRITLSSVCRSDIHSYHGLRPNPRPSILGHEIIGIVESLGEGIGPDLRGDALSVGDRITWTEYFRPGASFERDVLGLPQKAPGLRKYGHDRSDEDPHFLGGFAEYCYIQPGTGTLRLPAEILDEEAAPLNCGVATMIAVTEAAAIGLGDTVVVQGLGLLGLYGCAIARARGARRVIGLDTEPARLELARRFGADTLIDLRAQTDDEVVGQLAHVTPAGGADAALEVCGHPEAVPLGIRLLRVGGRYVLAGLVNPGSEFTLDGNDVVRGYVQLRGVHNYHPRHLVEALDFVMEHRDRFPFRELIDAKFPLEAVDAAFQQAADRRILRAGIAP